MNELIKASAREVVQKLSIGEVSPLDCLDALEKRIADVNAPVNALVTLCFDQARNQAKALMKKRASERGVLQGMPVTIKDLMNVKGVRSTQGSRIFADRIAEESDIMVRHLEGEGGVVYSMSNTPEFGAGAQTFNDVFGITRNPWDTRLTPAGSSGGAAVALATGMAWLAHGSDLGGSLRNPASFCGIVGMRPSPGRVAVTPGGTIDATLGLDGPMARDVEDLALMLDAMAGQEPGDPLSLPKPNKGFRAELDTSPKVLRLAVSTDLGITPVDPEVADLISAAAQKISGSGIKVEQAHPQLPDAMNAFQVLRSLGYAGMGPLLHNDRDKLKPEVIWNIEKGLRLSGEEVAIAEAQRGTLFRNMHQFFETYDAILCPATIVPPFPVEQRYVKHCNGVEFETYIDWLLIAAVATLSMCPAISIPCGFTKAGLPVGLQIISPNRSEAKLLAIAKQLEERLELGKLTPINPNVTHVA